MILRRPWLGGILLGTGLGWVAAGFEFVQVGLSTRLPLTISDALWLGALNLALVGGLGGLLGFFIVPAVRLMGRKMSRANVLATTASLVTFLLAAIYLGLVAKVIWEQGRLPAALAMAACPSGLAGVVWFHAGYLLRRSAVGYKSRWGWMRTSFLFGLMLTGIGVAYAVGDDAGSTRALKGDPNVLVVTIDTLRRDHVSVYLTEEAQPTESDALAEEGETEPPDQDAPAEDEDEDGEGTPGEKDAPAKAKNVLTPRMDALAEDGLLFLNAVTPTPETGPSHAALFTGLHPLRSRVLSNGHHLGDAYTTLAERLQEEGYATGAFVSSFAVDSRLGLDQGFDVYDDDFLPRFRGATDLVFGRLLIPVLFKLGKPEEMPWLLERQGKKTNRRAMDWIRARQGHPWMVWVHWFEPHAPYESASQQLDHRALLSEPGRKFSKWEIDALRTQYRDEVRLADTLVGELLDFLEQLKVADDTLVVVTSDHGEQLGEHGIMFHHHGLYDESLRIPLIIRAPAQWGVVNRRISSQVRIMDIAPTVLKYIKLSPFEQTEGTELLGYATGVRSRDLACPLYGRREASLREGVLLGLRSNDIKYIQDPASMTEELYDLVMDPSEASNLAGDPRQSVPLGLCRGQVAPNREALGFTGSSQPAEVLSPEVDRATLDRLEVLGYTE